MANNIDYVQGRYLDYYTSNEFKFDPLFDPTDDIEWGYTTKQGSAYRHFNSTEVESSITDMRENNGFGVYHSLTEYENPSESEYSKKSPTKTRIGIKIQTKSEIPTEEDWSNLLATAKETKSVLESEFPLEFNSIRTSINTVILISDPVSFDTPNNIHSRIKSYVSPEIVGSFDVSSLNTSRSRTSGSTSAPPSKLSKSVKKYVRGIYLEKRESALEALNGEDISMYSSTDDEEFPEGEIDDRFYELLNELQDIDGIASTKSFQFIQNLISRDEKEITDSYLTETAFNCKRISQYYSDKYLSENWLGDRNEVSISVLNTYSLIPCEGSLSTHGGFYVYKDDLDNLNYIPSDFFAEFYSDNSIKISLQDNLLDILNNSDLDLEADNTTQEVPEDLGMFLLSAGFAKKESEI